MRQVRAWRWWTAAEMEKWPAGHKRCRTCRRLKAFACFHRNTRTLFGLANDCKTCRKKVATAHWKRTAATNPSRVYFRAKARAKKLEREFTITLSDVRNLEWPTNCPILDIPMSSPSLDRINSSKGYVHGNIQIISTRANMLKNNGTLAEFSKLVAWMEARAGSVSSKEGDEPWS